MKTSMSFFSCLAITILIVAASATIAAAAAGTDTCAGENATIGATCTPLMNATSASNGNTAFGSDALQSNTTGFNNTASGEGALSNDTMGENNTATGEGTLFSNTTGGANTATGVFALQANTTGTDKTAAGLEALDQNTTGADNTAAGFRALQNSTSGSSNIGIGNNAGGNLTTGSNNIEIYDPGVAGESNTIRIGTQGTQTDTFIAGIFGTPKIKKACQSARYTHDIHDMGDASDRLMKLRPVTFTYKADSDGIPQYGLIAEEVEKVYPELVIDGADGKAETVEYQALPAMLLNEIQKQSRQIAALQRQLTALQNKDKQIDALAERLDTLERQARASRPDRIAAALR
jgi:hypothetical protein